MRMTLYQTVEDRDNPDYIEVNAPFICETKNAWLGRGYYFWDTHVENAHWWGNVHYNRKYVIVEYDCDFYATNKCFDLQGNMEHLKYFYEVIAFLKKQGLHTSTTTVAKVIEYLKDKTDFSLLYDAIRVYGHLSKKDNNTISFEIGKKYYLELMPAVQLCLFKKTSLNLSEGNIIYPDYYTSDYSNFRV